MTQGGSLIRGYLERGETLLAVGVYDALSARIAAAAGAPCVYATGYGASASRLGMPDIGLMTMREMADHLRSISGAVSCPLIADADTGYGGPINVWRTVTEWEQAGVGLIQIEDQVWPKRCGHMEGKQLVSVEEMVQRVRVAAAARSDADFLIMARTDAIAVEGFDAAIERARAYSAAGADVLFVEAPRTPEDLARIPKLLDKPLLANMVEGGKTPFCSVAELADLGYAIALYPISTLLSAARAVKETVNALVGSGTTAGTQDRMMSFPEFNETIGLAEFLKWQDR